MPEPTVPDRDAQSETTRTVALAGAVEQLAEAERALRDRYVRVGLLTVSVANGVFFVLRLATEVGTGRRTGYLVNLVGLVGSVVAYGVNRRAKGRARALALHAAIGLACICLLVPVVFGMVSSPWWLVLLPLGAYAVIGRDAAFVWGAIAAAASLVAEFLPRVGPDVAGEPFAEAVAARVVLVGLVVLLIVGQDRVKRAHEDALANALRELRRTNEKLLAAGRAKSAFLANVSHEIRTPLAGVIGLTRLAADAEDERRRADLLASTEASARDLLAIVNDILDVTRIEADRIVIEPVELALDELVAGALRPLAVSARERGLYFRIGCDPTLAVHRRADGVRVRQVLVNLVGNALKFTDRGGVDVFVDEVDGRVRFAVTDTGIGVRDEDRERIFDAFTQAEDSASRRYGGTGLGLTISRRIARLLGGDLTLESRHGHGARFTFTVPMPVVPTPPRPPEAGLVVVVAEPPRQAALVPVVGAAGYTPSAAVPADAPGALADGRVRAVVLDGELSAEVLVALVARARGASLTAVVVALDPSVVVPDGATRFEPPLFPRGLVRAFDRATRGPDPRRQSAEYPLVSRRVLLVEDQEVNRMVATMFLESAGHRVVAAEHGRHALDLLAADPDVDLVLTDLQMPVLDGDELVRVLRAREAEGGRRYPIAVLTAHAMRGDETRLLASGADAYLTKPFEPEDLERLVLRLTAG